MYVNISEDTAANIIEDLERRIESERNSVDHIRETVRIQDEQITALRDDNIRLDRIEINNRPCTQPHMNIVVAVKVIRAALLEATPEELEEIKQIKSGETPGHMLKQAKDLYDKARANPINRFEW